LGTAILNEAKQKSEKAAPGGYGLRTGILSQAETLAQSLSSIAPTACVAMGIPLVIAASGLWAWLAFLVATVAVLLVAANVNVFARDSASPGSLYGFVRADLGHRAGVLTGWALLIAYVGTASAVTGGIVQYTQTLFSGQSPPITGSIALILVSVATAAAFAYCNVELSARFMLWIECISVAAIVLLFVFPSHADRLIWDARQFKVSAFRLAPLGSGLVLATFSFVGFESATALGAEAKSPLRTIPRAMLVTVLLSGIFFVFSAYAEVAGFGGNLGVLASSGAPLQVLADLKGLHWIVPIISLGALISFFACVLASITAAARIALLMSRHGLLAQYLDQVHDQHRTPYAAVLVTAVATLVPALLLTLGHVSAFDLYGWLGTVSTYGFVTAYVLVVIAAPVHLFRRQQLNVWKVALSLAALLFLGATCIGSLNSGAVGPGKWLAPTYLGLLLSGCVWTLLRSTSRATS
jgi:amino acid transporter